MTMNSTNIHIAPARSFPWQQPGHFVHVETVSVHVVNLLSVCFSINVSTLFMFYIRLKHLLYDITLYYSSLFYISPRFLMLQRHLLPEGATIKKTFLHADVCSVAWTELLHQGFSSSSEKITSFSSCSYRFCNVWPLLCSIRNKVDVVSDHVSLNKEPMQWCMQIFWQLQWRLEQQETGKIFFPLPSKLFLIKVTKSKRPLSFSSL